jgi:hypothetical protein
MLYLGILEPHKRTRTFLLISYIRSGYQEDTKDRLAQGEEVSLHHIIMALGGN